MKQQVTKRTFTGLGINQYKKCVIYSGNGSYYHVVMQFPACQLENNKFVIPG
jgi:hypothetical protein